MNRYILETKELTKKFGRQKAVANLSLQIEKNSVYGLLGPNGAGKSTTLKMITGMLHKTSGEILFEDKPWSRADLEKIGALIEMPPLYDNLTAWENLKVRTLLLGLPDSRFKEYWKKEKWAVLYRNEAEIRYCNCIIKSSTLAYFG